MFITFTNDKSLYIHTAKRNRNIIRHSVFGTVLLCVCMQVTAAANSRVTDVVSIDVSPKVIHLADSRAAMQLLVFGKNFDGDQIDLTHVATLTSPEIVSVENGYIRPLRDGKGTLVVTVEEHTVSVPVSVINSDQAFPVSFRSEVLAVLTKQGCNSGSCHGKPNGRGALELSLNAFDPALDERSLIRSGFVRFTEPLDPGRSLLLRKPTLRVPHGGGKRLRPEGDQYAILQQWIHEGSPSDTATAPACVNLRIEPAHSSIVHLDRGTTQQYRVSATFSDGTTRDVTRISQWTISHQDVAAVNVNGLVMGHRRGQTAVSVRYLDDLMSVLLTVVQDVPGFAWNNPATANLVDTHVHNKLRQLKYLPSDVCDDSTFIRRLSLDVRGLLPTVDETKTFLADNRNDKRAQLIDQFLQSPAYAAYWSLRMADLLRINHDKLSPENAADFSRWVRETVNQNLPYDKFVTQLLTATGRTSEVKPANFFRVTDDTKMVAETVTQLFMGSRIMCAQCHNHPYERWTQDNYYQIAAAFHQIDRVPLADGQPLGKKGRTDKKVADQRIAPTADGHMSNPRTGIVQQPWPTNVDRSAGEDRRLAFANWLTEKGNPYFARVAANRIWAQLFGKGLVEPIDDFRSSNPSVNTELLDALAIEFEESDFDRKHVLRLILNSHTWQRSSETNDFNETDDTLFSHSRIRLLSAEQIQDAITRLCDHRYEETSAEIVALALQLEKLKNAADPAPTTEAQTEDAAEKLGAVQKELSAARQRLQDYFMTQQHYPHLTPFLKAFGQPERKTACACERRDEVSLDQALQLMNSPLIREKVAHGANRLQELPDDQLIQELYLAAFARVPLDTEKETVTGFIGAAANRRQAIEDVVWSIINTNEFMFQH